ncbi:MAG: NHL repeat-containing protein [Acidobacteriota bacterium]
MMSNWQGWGCWSLLLCLSLPGGLFAQFDASLTIGTVAGDGSAAFGGDGGPANLSKINLPMGVAVDLGGNIYFADGRNQRIRRIDTNGIITTVAGNGSKGFDGDGGPALTASLNDPLAVTLDSQGNLYIADSSNFRIRKVDAGGTISTIAGNGQPAYVGDGGPATSAGLTPVALAVYGNGLFAADPQNHRVRRISLTTGIIITVAGNGQRGFSGDGGAALLASLNEPLGLAIDSSGIILVADTFNDRIRKIDSGGLISTIAGGGNQLGDGGPATSAQLRSPWGIALGRLGELYIAESSGHRVRVVEPAGTIRTAAGTGTEGYNGDGIPATSASLNRPVGLAVDPTGIVYIGDSNNNRVRRLLSSADLPFSWLLPSSARAGGLGGTFFTTDLTLANLGLADAVFRLKFLGNNTDGRPGPERMFGLAAGRSVTYFDVLQSVFSLDFGFGAILVQASAPAMSVQAQTSTPGMTGGTYGQSVPATGTGDLIGAGFTRSIAAVREDGSFRTNLILANATRSEVTVRITLVSEEGAILGTGDQTLPPLGMTQLTRVVRTLGVSENVVGGRIVLTCLTQGGTFAAYASVIDNQTGDPRTLLPH